MDHEPLTGGQATREAPDFDAITTALRQLGSPAEAAECQGQLCGMLCTKGEEESAQWLARSFPDSATGDLLACEARDVLRVLYDTTRGTLNDSMLDFQLLLPADDASMTLRAGALGEWCQGFLCGLAEGGVHDIDALPGEAAEMVRDLAGIARAGSFDIKGDEEDEAAYAELVEYVRIGVLLVQEELHPRRTLPEQDATLH